MRLHEIHAAYPGLESLDSQTRARRHSPATVVKFDGRRHVLPIGDSDTWALYYADKDRERVYCVSLNHRFPYAGVQAYDRDDQEPREEVSIFLQSTEQVDEALGRDALEPLTDRTIARRLIEYLDAVTA